MNKIAFGKEGISIKGRYEIGSIWERIKFSYNIIKNGGYNVTSEYTFKEGERENAIYILSDTDRTVINAEKAFPEAILPTKAHKSDVGWDLYSPIEFRLNPGEIRRIDFGIRLDIPDGYYIYVHNRSGIVWKYNTMMALGSGVVDTGYRGTIMAPFYNFSMEQMRFGRGDRLAQMVIRRVEDVDIVEGSVDTNTDRKDGGFGSTGR